MGNGETIIKGTDLAIGYRGRHVTVVREHLDFSLHAGELTCLLGANGVGKSTLLRTLSAAQSPLSGCLELMGRPLSGYSVRERSRLIGVVLTDKTQTGGLTVYELVALGRQPHTGFFGRLDRHDRDMIDYAMQAVGMAHKAKSYVAQLSDGERQKVMIAKALVQECPLILLDEPTAFLDIVSRMEIMTLLRRLAVEEHKAVLLSTHDVEQALTLSDRLWLLAGTYGIECGCTEDLILANRIDALFERQSRISFDLAHGGFVQKAGDRKYIYIDVPDGMLRRWTQNALNRHNYSCLNFGETDAMSDVPVLKVRSPGELLLSIGNTDFLCSSFENLFKVLGD